MNKQELEDIKALCETIREALEIKRDEHFLFYSFPKGCCRDTSILIAQYLIKNCGYQESDIRLCFKNLENSSPSHAWLVVKGVMIDVTADQFGAQYPKVIVLDRQSEYFFHKEDRSNLFVLKEYLTCLDLDFLIFYSKLEEYILKKHKPSKSF